MILLRGEKGLGKQRLAEKIRYVAQTQGVNSLEVRCDKYIGPCVHEFRQLLEELKTRRDELALKIHLGTREAQDEFDKLEAQWNEFSAKAKLDESADGIGQALGALGDELRKGYERLKKAL